MFDQILGAGLASDAKTSKAITGHPKPTATASTGFFFSHISLELISGHQEIWCLMIPRTQDKVVHPAHLSLIVRPREHTQLQRQRLLMTNHASASKTGIHTESQVRRRHRAEQTNSRYNRNPNTPYCERTTKKLSRVHGIYIQPPKAQKARYDLRVCMFPRL